MLIQNLTNASILITGEREKIIIDPWFEDGIYLGTWHNFPRVSEKKLQDYMENVNYCLITHLHKDHFNIESIKKYLNKSTKFVLPKVFGYQVMFNSLKSNGFEDVVILDCGVSMLETNEFSIQSIEPLNTSGVIDVTTNALSIDAGFIVYSKKHSKKLIFLADNNLYDLEKVKKNLELLESPDLIAFAYSGFACEYPFKFKFNDKEMVDICNSLEKIRFKKQTKCLNLIKPKNILVYSSEFIPVHKHSKKWLEIFPQIWTSDKFKVAKKYSAECGAIGFAMYPDDKLIFEYNEEISADFKKIDKNNLIKEMIDYAGSIQSDSYYDKFCEEGTSIEEIVELLRGASQNYKNSLLRNNLSPSQVLNFYSNGFYIGSVSTDGELYTKNQNGKDCNFLDIDAELFLLKRLLLNQEHWNDASLSMRILWNRVPDIYCSDTLNALNYLRN